MYTDDFTNTKTASLLRRNECARENVEENSCFFRVWSEMHNSLVWKHYDFLIEEGKEEKEAKNASLRSTLNGRNGRVAQKQDHMH